MTLFVYQLLLFFVNVRIIKGELVLILLHNNYTCIMTLNKSEKPTIACKVCI